MSVDPLTGRPRGLSRQSGLGNLDSVPSKPATLAAPTPRVMQKTLGMNGPFPLTGAEIAKHCSSWRPHGNYAFGRIDDQDIFHVHYVGRFNAGGERLKHGIGRYSHFKISHANSEKEAVEKECRNWHDFNPPDNKIHPACPGGFCCPQGCK